MKKLVSLVVAILIAESVLTGLIPHARGYLFEFLESKESGVYLALGLYFLTYFSLDFFQAIKGYFVTRTANWFRAERTKQILEKGHDTTVSNDSQRIQEDIKLSYHSRITVWCEYFISGTIVIQLLLINLSEPLLVIGALGYSILSVWIAVKFNPRLTSAEKSVQEQEASYRRNISVIYLGFANMAVMKAALIRTQYLLFTKLQLGFMQVLPYIVLIPGLIAGDITLGDLMKHQATFSLIVVNAAILIQMYPLLIQGKASEERVKEIER